MTTATKTSEWSLADVAAPPLGVDRDNKIIRGYVVAQAGPFKTIPGEFDEKSLSAIVSLMKKERNGLKSRFTHATPGVDSLGKFLGRVKNPRLDSVRLKRDGKTVEVPAVRGDLHLDPSSFRTPYGDLGGYVMDLADSDPEAISSSLVVKSNYEPRIDPKTRRPLLSAETGEPLPTLWRPIALQFSDVCASGQAVDGLLSVDDAAKIEPVDPLQCAFDLADLAFPDADRATLSAWFETVREQYLAARFGEDAPPPTKRLTIEEARLELSRFA